MSRNSITEFQDVRGSCHQEFLWRNVCMWAWGCWEPVGRARTTKATQEADLALTRPSLPQLLHTLASAQTSAHPPLPFGLHAASAKVIKDLPVTHSLHI